MIGIDNIDRALLRELQKNGSAKASDLGKAVGLSQSAAWRRIKRLEDAKVINGKRIVLRKIIPSDLDVLLTWENDPANHEYSEVPSFYSREMMNDFVCSNHDLFINNQLRLMIIYNNFPVGCVDLFDFDPFHLRAGVGVLIDAKYRDIGLAKESLLLNKN